MEELQISFGKQDDLQEKKKISLARQEEMVYSCLGLYPKNIEQIIQEIPISTREISGILLKLELEGLIEEPLKNYYARAGG